MAVSSDRVLALHMFIAYVPSHHVLLRLDNKAYCLTAIYRRLFLYRAKLCLRYIQSAPGLLLSDDQWIQLHKCIVFEN